jgi:hypothetical protein
MIYKRRDVKGHRGDKGLVRNREARMGRKKHGGKRIWRRAGTVFIDLWNELPSANCDMKWSIWYLNQKLRDQLLGD